MDVSKLQSLPTEDKLTWLRTPEGLEQLQSWFSAQLKLKDVVQILCIHDSTFYHWRTYPEIGEIAVRAGYKEVKPAKPDLSRDMAYRLICGLDYSNRGTILAEYGTAIELWQAPFIHNYFKSFGCSESDYLADYLHQLSFSGIYRLSNTFTACYCKINRRGLIKILKPTSQNAL